MGLNAALIQARFDDIRESLERLESIRQRPREAFLADQETMDDRPWTIEDDLGPSSMVHRRLVSM